MAWELEPRPPFLIGKPDMPDHVTRDFIEVEAPDEGGKELVRVRTSCADCKFADYGPGDDGFGRAVPTQTGCALGRLDAYRRAGATVIDATDGIRNFFIIDERACTARQPAIEGEPRGAAISTAELEEAWARLRVRVHVFLVAGPGTDAQQICHGLERLVADRPAGITLVLAAGQSFREGVKLCAVYGGDISRTTALVETPSPSSLVKAVFDSCYRHAEDSGAGYFLLVQVGQPFGASVVSRLDSLVTHELRQVAFVRPAATPNGPHGLLVARALYKHLQGNAVADLVQPDGTYQRFDDISSKLEAALASQGLSHMMMDADDVWPGSCTSLEGGK